MSGNLRPSKSLPQHNPHICTRKRTTPSSRRSSMDTYSTKASSKHVIAEKSRKARHSMPALPSDPLTPHLTTSEVNWEHPAQGSPGLLSTGANHSTDFGFVSLDPPITRAVLSELDVPRLEHNLVLRHHLNFDPEIEFRVETNGPQAEERRERSCQYWLVLAIEIALWLGHSQRMTGSYSGRPLNVSLPRPGTRSFPQVATLRLPRLFGAVQDILKQLMPSEEWPVIDAALDLRLLIQQLEHGVCDFVALSEWLGNYLRRFCSPTHHRLLHTMTSAIRLGVENSGTDGIVDGLIALFEILQGIKLEATNHSTRNLRLAWVEDTIAFEQAVFRQHMADGWDVMGARIWFDDLQAADRESDSGMWTLVKILTDAVAYYHQHFPPTLTLDHDRLRKLQMDFQVLVYQAACRRTLTGTLRNLGWTHKVSKACHADLFSRVAILISHPESQYDYWQRRESVALEVVRAAYKVCGNHKKLPQAEDLDFAEDCLRRCCDPRGPIFPALQGSLAKELADKVDDEVSAIGDLTPDQLMRRLLPQQPGFCVQSEIEGLVHIAKRIAHIAELHWRVWGPILYERPMHVAGRALGDNSSVEEGLDEQGSSESDESEPSSGNSGCG